MAELTLPFEGLPDGWVAAFTVALAVILAMFSWTVLLFARAQRARRRPVPAPADGPEAFEWLFIVAALNEEITIRDSVRRLLAVPLARRRVVVVDDGGGRTPEPELLRELENPTCGSRRDPPDARRAKAAALNHAEPLSRPRAGRSRPRSGDRGGGDADGRLDPDAPRFAAAHFADPEVGGVQPWCASTTEPPADLHAGHRVLGLRMPLPGRAKLLGNRGNGGTGSSPAQCPRRGGRRRRPMARPAHEDRTSACV